MWDTIGAIHKALKIESTWAFVAVIALIGASLGGAAAWVIDVGYKNSAEYKAEHSPKQKAVTKDSSEATTVTAFSCSVPEQKKDEIKVNPQDGLNYVLIPKGTFTMGCPPEAACWEEEKPPHRVTISNGFWLSQTEVTVGAYKRFVNKRGGVAPS